MDAKHTPHPRNPATQARFQREILWQVYVPLGVGGVLVLAVMLLTVAAAYWPVNPVSAWADVSVIYLGVFALLGGLVQLAVLVGLCAGLWFALRELPGYFKIAQDVMVLVAWRTAEICQKVAGVFIAPQATLSAAQKAAESARSLIPLGRKP